MFDTARSMVVFCIEINQSKKLMFVNVVDWHCVHYMELFNVHIFTEIFVMRVKKKDKLHPSV